VFSGDCCISFFGGWGKEFFRHAGCEVPRGVWLRRDFAALNLGAGAEMEERGSRHGVLNRGAGLAAIGGGLAAGIAGPPNRPATGMGSGGAAVRSPGVRSGRALAAAPVLPGNYIPFTQACARYLWILRRHRRVWLRGSRVLFFTGLLRSFSSGDMLGFRIFRCMRPIRLDISIFGCGEF